MGTRSYIALQIEEDEYLTIAKCLLPAWNAGLFHEGFRAA